MKDQKPEDKTIQKDQKPGQQSANTNLPKPDPDTVIEDNDNNQKLRTADDQNSRSADNDTIGIP